MPHNVKQGSSRRLVNNFSLDPVFVAVFVFGTMAAVGASLRFACTVALLWLGLALIRTAFGRNYESGSLSTVFLSGFIALFVLSLGSVLFLSHDEVLARTAIALVTVLMALLAVTAKESVSVEATTQRHRHLPDSIEFHVLCVPTLLLGLRGFVPLLPFSLSTLLAIWFWKHRRISLLRVTAPITLIAGVLLSRNWSMKEPYWFWLSYDQLFRASLATGLTRWGYTDLNSAAGLTLHYHWLSEGVAGVLSRLGASDEYFVVTRVAPTLFFVGCFAAIWRLVLCAGLNKGAAIVGASFPSLVLLELDPYSIGTLAGSAILCVFLQYSNPDDHTSFRWRAHLVVLSLVLLMTQTPFGIIATVTITILLTQRLWLFRSNVVSQILFLAALIAIPIVLRNTLLKPGDGIETSGSFGLNNVLGFKGFNAPFGLDPISPTLFRALNSVAFLIELSIVVVPVVGALLVAKEYRLVTSNGQPFLRQIVAICVSTFGLVNLVDIGVAQGKLFSGVLLGLLPISFAVVWDSASRKGQWYAVIGLLAGLVLAATFRFARNIDNDLVASILSLAVLGSSALLMISSVLAGVSCSRAKQHGSLRFRAVIGAVLPLFVVAGIAIGRHDRVLGYISRSTIPNEQMIGTESTRTCLEWIKKQTSPDTIIATNLFDPDLLPGSEKLYLVSTWTKRRVWIDGLYNSRRYFEEETARRVSLLESPRDLPLAIEYIVVNRSYDTAPDSLSSFTISFFSDDCQVLERKDV